MKSIDGTFILTPNGSGRVSICLSTHYFFYLILKRPFFYNSDSFKKHFSLIRCKCFPIYSKVLWVSRGKGANKLRLIKLDNFKTI